jgi:hypothetical protein
MDDSNIRTIHSSRNASKSSNENNRTADTVWAPSKAGMLAKTVKPTAAYGGRPTAAKTIGTSQCQQQKGYPQQQGCQKKYRLANNSTIASAGMPTVQYGRQQLMSFRGNLPKGKEFAGKDLKKRKNSPFLV